MDSFLQPSADIKASFLIKTSSLEKPELIGVFSSEKQSETEIRLDASNCKYLKKQLLTNENCSIDLKVYDDIRKEYEEKNHKKYKSADQPMTLFVEYLEKFVMKDTFIKYNANKLFKADIICHARVLLKMIMVHGDLKESFSLLCTKYKGNIYICKKRTGSKVVQKDPYEMIARHALYSGAYMS